MKLLWRFYRKLKPFSQFEGRRDFSLCDGLRLVSGQEAHNRIIGAIASGEALSVMRTGGVEAQIIMWGLGLKTLGRFGVSYPTFYWETKSGPTNAGIRPRNHDSYREFARLAGQAAGAADVLGVWHAPYEEVIYRHSQPRALACHVEKLSPTFRVKDHWIRHLGRQRLLVFSPFEDSIRSQLPKMNDIWAPLDLDWTARVDTYRFPYLIDDACPLHWKEVYSSCVERLEQDDYDIAMFGCGGLGIPLAKIAKQRGKIGMHLGGLLQLLFGIYGSRHTDQFWHAECINMHWKRPEPSERAQSFKRVEGGCYW